MSVEERVGPRGGVGELPGVGVEVPAGRLNRIVVKDALEDMEVVAPSDVLASFGLRIEAGQPVLLERKQLP